MHANNNGLYKDNFVSLLNSVLESKASVWVYIKSSGYDGETFHRINCSLSEHTWIDIVGQSLGFFYTVYFYKKGTEVFKYNVWVFTKLHRDIQKLRKKLHKQKIEENQYEFFKEFIGG